jgi:ABC-type anion transport system duplicated permease subunit
MSEELLATEVGLARNQIITHADLMELVATGSKRRIKKMPDVVVETEVAEPSEPVDTRTEWQKAGFTPAYESLVNHFENLRESHVLSPDVRSMVQLAQTATRVEEFEAYSDNALLTIISTVSNTIPRIESDTLNFIQTLSAVPAMAIETDFI